MWDSFRESSVVAAQHERSHPPRVQGEEPGGLERSAQARHFATSLTIWFAPAMTWEATPTGKRGRQRYYTDPEPGLRGVTHVNNKRDVEILHFCFCGHDIFQNNF